MVQLLWTTVWWFLKTSNIELYDPAIPLWGTSTKDQKAGTQPDIPIPMFSNITHNSQKAEKKSKCP